MKLDEACAKILEDRDIKTSTRNTICNNLKMLSKDLKEEDIKKLLNNHKRIEEYFNNKKGRGEEGLAVNSFKSYYTNIKSAAVALGCTKAAVDFYDKKMVEYAKLSGLQSDESKVPEKFKEGQYPPWSDIASLPSKFTGDDEYTVEHAIVSLYVMQPPRRLQDYQTLYLLKEKPSQTPRVKSRFATGHVDTQTNIPYNYIYPNGEQYNIVIQDYKTDRRAGFGVYENTWSKELSKVIKGYVKKNKVKEGGPLFPIVKGKKRGQVRNSFSKEFVKAFGMHYKKYELTEQDVRQMHVTYEVNGKPISVKEKKRIAKMMGHTLKTQQELYGKNQSPHQSEASGSGSAPIQTQEIEPDPIEDIEEAPEEPQEQEEEQEVPQEPEVIEVVEKTTKEEVLATIKKYYELKIKLMEKKLAMFEGI